MLDSTGAWLARGGGRQLALMFLLVSGVRCESVVRMLSLALVLVFSHFPGCTNVLRLAEEGRLNSAGGDEDAEAPSAGRLPASEDLIIALTTRLASTLCCQCSQVISCRYLASERVFVPLFRLNRCSRREKVEGSSKLSTLMSDLDRPPQPNNRPLKVRQF